MALVVCPECGRKNVSSMAAACPDCGFPIAEHFKMLAVQEHAETVRAMPDGSSMEDGQDGQAGQAGLKEETSPVDRYSEIRRLCDEFLEHAGENAGSFRFTPKLKKGLKIPDDADVYLAHDDTIFHSGKNGFAITSQGIYCRDLMEETEVTSMEELGSLTELSWEEDGSHNYILAGEKKLTYYTDGEEEIEYALMALLTDIVQVVSGNRIAAPQPACDAVQVSEGGENVTEPAARAMGEAVCFYMAQKALALKPQFDIVDQDNNPVYHIEGDLARLNFSIQRNGEEVLKLKKKLVAIMPEYTIERNHAEIATIKKKFRLTNPELHGQAEGKELRINGDLFGYDFDIVTGDAVIGHVDTEFGHWSDHYRISVFDAAMQDVIIALAVICDNVADKEEEYS